MEPSEYPPDDGNSPDQDLKPTQFVIEQQHSIPTSYLRRGVMDAVSPKIIHTTASNFMNVVQRLTGVSSEVFVESSGGDVSPAARIATTDNASPRGGKEPATRDETVEITTTIEEETAEFLYNQRSPCLGVHKDTDNSTISIPVTQDRKSVV